MKKITCMLLFLPSLLLGQRNAAPCEVLAKINTLIQREHFRPKPIDDSLSVFVFDGFLDILDPDRNMITKTDFDRLQKHRLSLDDKITNGQCDFMSEFETVYRKSLERKKTLLERLQKQALDYSSKDSVFFTKEKFAFDLAETDLDRIWKKRLRYEILEDVSKLGTNYDSLSTQFAKLEAAAHKKIFESKICRVNSVLGNTGELISGMWTDFMNLYCNYFDPHSNYFTTDSKSSFMSSLSTTTLSLGMQLSLDDNEEIVIREIEPGGPAALTQKLDRDDVIVGVSNKHGKKYSVSCASLDLVGEFLFSDSNTNLGLTVRKKNGQQIDVEIEKKVMKASENSICGFVAEATGTKVGYINIPNFYSNFEYDSVEGCSDDVAHEITKLQANGIDGLVIDLQGNGGGSMDEAIRLAGMFIDYGPLSVLADSSGKQTIIKDMNRGILYTGPIVILIDGNSASASEFFAAAMQDYERAIVIGSPSLGKASMQTIMPITEKEDFAKITIQKFYRITGQSAQISGVLPDVKMPVLFDSITRRENNFKTALPNDAIVTKARFQKFVAANRQQAIEASRVRIAQSKLLNDIGNLDAQINNMFKNQKKAVRLTFKDVFTDVHHNDKLWTSIKTRTWRENSVAVTNTVYQQERLAFDDTGKLLNEFKISELKANPYLDEAIMIINDLKKK